MHATVSRRGPNAATVVLTAPRHRRIAGRLLDLEAENTADARELAAAVRRSAIRKQRIRELRSEINSLIGMPNYEGEAA